MGVGCLVALLLWTAVGSLLLGSLVPIALGLLYVAFLIVYRGLHSEWPLWF